jgi:hypothetical protein
MSVFFSFYLFFELKSLKIASSRDLESEFAAMHKPFEVKHICFSPDPPLTPFFRAKKTNITGLIGNALYSVSGE